MKELVLLLVDSGFHVGTELLHVLLYAVDTAKGYHQCRKNDRQGNGHEEIT